MKKDSLRLGIIILLTGVCSLLIFKTTLTHEIDNKNLSNFPYTIHDWAGENIPMSEYVYQSLGTPYAFMRNYNSKNFEIPVNLTIVWCDDRRIVFHTPEECLGGVGELVKEKGHVTVMLRNSTRIAQLIVERNNQRQMVLYFYDTDGYVTTSESEIRMKILMRRLKFKRSSVAFVRLMAPIISDKEETMSALKNFLYLAYPAIQDYTYIERINKQALR